MCRKPPQESKRREHHPIIGDTKAPPGLCAGICLSKKMRMWMGEGPRADQMWEKKCDNWPEVILPYIMI